MHFAQWLAIMLASTFISGCTSITPSPPAEAGATYLTLPERASLDLPYSDAVRVGDLLLLSGAIGSAPGTRDLAAGGVVPETRQTLENIKRNLEAHGSSLGRVVKCTVMLADIGDFDAMNAVYREYFPRHKPARSTFGVNGLGRGARIEIECVALAD